MIPFPGVGGRRFSGDALARDWFVVAGFLPIGGLSLALFELIPLHLSALFLVLPALAFTVFLGVRFPAVGKLALAGLLCGMIATGIYDLARSLFILAFGLHDFIPVIGRMALMDEQASAFWGYAWRYVLNGGAMGVAYAFLPMRGVGRGMIYGTGICGCLFGTLMLAPHAQELMFRLTPITGVMALTGHLVYGGMLGLLMPKIFVNATTL